MAKVIIITGAHNSGKTTFIEKVTYILKQMGFNVAYIKHDPKGKAVTDTYGKDSWKVYNAGAKQVIVASPSKISLFINEDNYSLEDLIKFLSFFNPDLIIVEGFKSSSNYDKFEIIRKEENRDLLLSSDKMLRGVITDYYEFPKKFDINRPDEFVNFLIKNYLVGE